MTWNYRVVKRTVDGESEYGIFEVYYDDAGEPRMMSDPMRPSGETLEDLAADLEHMQRAVTHPLFEPPTHWVG